MEALYNTYKEKFDSLEKNSSAPSSSSAQVASSQDGNSVANAFLFGTRSVSSKVKSELKKYIEDPREQPYEGYDILRWWKLNAQRYLILSRMAKDILAIQVSTVASESAFSTGSRILDPYRTRLSVSIVEALICTQDWVTKSKKVINMLDEIDDLQKDEEVALEVEKELKKVSISGKQVENLD